MSISHLSIDALELLLKLCNQHLSLLHLLLVLIWHPFQYQILRLQLFDSRVWLQWWWYHWLTRIGRNPVDFLHFHIRHVIPSRSRRLLLIGHFCSRYCDRVFNCDISLLGEHGIAVGEGSLAQNVGFHSGVFAGDVWVFYWIDLLENVVFFATLVAVILVDCVMSRFAGGSLLDAALFSRRRPFKTGLLRHSCQSLMDRPLSIIVVILLF